MQKKNKALIVDDSSVIVERMIPLLEDIHNIESVIHAGSYREAIELLHAHKPDLALLDIHLPGKSGIALLKVIKEKWSSMTVYMISNNASEHHRRVCQQLGADHFFDKSRDFHLIPDIISEECV